SVHLFLPHSPPPTELYPLSLHDALPISRRMCTQSIRATMSRRRVRPAEGRPRRRRPQARETFARASAATPAATQQAAQSPSTAADRKSTRLNSSHGSISYAVFCLKKKKK